MKRVSRGTGARFLAKSEINPANYFALFVKVLQGLLHSAVENHPAVNLDALLFVEVLGIADRRGRGGEINREFVTALFVFAFANLAHNEFMLLEPVIGDLVGALLGKRCPMLRTVTGVHAWLDLGDGL